MTQNAMTSKQRVMKLFAGEAVDRVPCFSGMGNVTTEGLKTLGHKFAAIHLDAKMMAEAAATSYTLLGIECGVVPFDLCVEAEAMGCEINVYAHSEDLLYPTIKKKLIHNEAEMEIAIPSDITKRGRVPLMVEAIGLLKKQLGDAGGGRFLRPRALHAGRPDHGAQRPAQALLQEAGQDRQAAGPVRRRDHPGRQGSTRPPASTT